MNSKIITMDLLYSELEKDQYPVIDKEAKIVTVINSEDQTKRIYRIVGENPIELEEIQIDLNKMASMLADQFDAKMLMDEVLRKTDTAQLLDIKERLEVPDASIKSKKGCFSMQIGGKRGRPVELVLIQ